MSPPIVFANRFGGVSSATWNAGGGSMSIVTPPSAAVGDDLVLAVALRSGAAAITALDGSATFAGWTLVQTIATANNKLYLFRLTMDASDIGTHTAAFTAATNGQAVMMALRGLQDVPALGVGTDVVASTSFVCPSVNLGAVSDGHLCLIFSDVVAATIPNTFSSDLLHVTDGVVGIEAVVFLPSTVGATGTRTGTVGGARSGIAASFPLVADAVVNAATAGLSFSLFPVGAIGLPAEGI